MLNRAQRHSRIYFTMARNPRRQILLAIPKKQPGHKAKQSGRLSHKCKPGPRPFAPTSAQRRRVMRAVAAGLTLKQIADGLGMPMRSVCRTFVAELAVGRAKSLMENLDRRTRLPMLAMLAHKNSCTQ
jgi:FixJ family two-component response regulator